MIGKVQGGMLEDSHLFSTDLPGEQSMWARERKQEYYSLLKGRLFGLLVGWPSLVTGLLVAMNLLLSDSGDAPDLRTTFLSSTISAFVVSWMVFLAYAIFDFTRMIVFDVRNKPNPIAHVLISVPTILYGIKVSNVLNRITFDQPAGEPGDIGMSLVLGLLGGLVFIFFFSYRSQRKEADQLRVATAEAELRVLRDQMRPHFLFNSLSSLAELIDSGSKSASPMTQKLSDLYRLILASSKHKTCTLESEMAIAKSYLDLERLRFEDRLTYSFEAKCDSAKVYLPSLVIQTLVENAVKHGIAKSEEGGAVSITAEQEKTGWTRISVRNSSPELKLESNSGTGLENSRKRLDLLYGSSHEFAIRQESNGETVATFRVSGEKFD